MDTTFRYSNNIFCLMVVKFEYLTNIFIQPNKQRSSIYSISQMVNTEILPGPNKHLVSNNNRYINDRVTSTRNGKARRASEKIFPNFKDDEKPQTQLNKTVEKLAFLKISKRNTN